MMKRGAKVTTFRSMATRSTRPRCRLVLAAAERADGVDDVHREGAAPIVVVLGAGRGAPLGGHRAVDGRRRGGARAADRHATVEDVLAAHLPSALEEVLPLRPPEEQRRVSLSLEDTPSKRSIFSSDLPESDTTSESPLRSRPPPTRSPPQTRCQIGRRRRLGHRHLRRPSVDSSPRRWWSSPPPPPPRHRRFRATPSRRPAHTAALLALLLLDRCRRRRRLRRLGRTARRRRRRAPRACGASALLADLEAPPSIAWERPAWMLTSLIAPTPRTSRKRSGGPVRLSSQYGAYSTISREPPA